MKIILFGTGDYYHKFRDWFYDTDIVCLLDNNEQKQNTLIDGKRVYAPIIGLKMEYDKVCILSVYYNEIKEQLMNLGVRESDIVHCSELHKYPEMIRSDRHAKIYCQYEDSLLAIKCTDKTILLMSHDLDYNGATLALYYAACILKDEGYDVWWASWTDGKVRKLIEEQAIGVIIDPKLQVGVFNEIEWMKSFDFIFCNTLLYYKLLSERDKCKKYIWWLHEPDMFYQSVDKDILKKIDGDNLKIYAVGEIAIGAFISNCPQMNIENLLYGIPDIEDCYEINQKTSDVMEIITIGNVQEYKGQDVLIGAIKKLPKEKQKRVHISIIGGSASEYYSKIVDMLEEIKDIVELIPPVTRTEVYEYYRKADLYICSSRQDCMPVVVAESMMCSLPSIVSDATGIAPYVRHDGGIVFKSEDVQELSDKIQWCLDNRDKLDEMGRLARKQYEKVFSLKSFRERLIRIVNDNFKI